MLKSNHKISAIILAAGAGKRMHSNIPKVLHTVGVKPIIVKTLETLDKIYAAQTIIVASPANISQIKKEAGDKYNYVIQKLPLGTADAAAAGLKKVNPEITNVAVMYGDDTAFYKPQTLTAVVTQHQKTKATITFITLDKEHPSGFGRIIRRNGKVTAIVEEKDANSKQRKIREVNDGFYIFDKQWLSNNLPKIKPSVATGELYLTDLIGLALSQNLNVDTYILKDLSQWHGINTPEDLIRANQKMKPKIHIMGAAGSGASAIFQIAQKLGYEVSGCDINPNSSYSKTISSQITKSHSPDHLENTDTLILSEAILRLDPENEEIKKAEEKNIPIMLWEQFQSQFLQKDKFVIAIAGAYGKSTTTAMVSSILVDSGLDPTCEVGATVIEWRTNFRTGKSKYYVCEVDEYYDKYLFYSPDVAVILNVGWDHPDFFKDKDSVVNSYKKFISKIKKNGTLVIGADKDLNKIASSARHDINVVKVKDFGKLKLSIIGGFRKENSDAALTVASLLKIDSTKAQKSVEQFSGLKRRLEYKGKIANCKIYDDYAVQPYTIAKTANALKERFPWSRIALVLEPHTFSRIKTFFGEFATSIKKIKVDDILITDVFAAREKGDPATLSKELAKSAGEKAAYTGSIKETAQYLKKNLSKYDIVLSMGAGNVYQIYDLIKN